MGLEFKNSFNDSLENIVYQKSKFDKSVYEYINAEHDWFDRRRKGRQAFHELDILLEMLGYTNVSDSLFRIYIEEKTLEVAIEEKIYFDRKFKYLVKYCRECDKLIKIVLVDKKYYLSLITPSAEYLLSYFYDTF